MIQENGVATPEEGYVTDRFGDAACRFIEQHKDEPFFLFVSFTAPHGPREPKRTDRNRTAHIKPFDRRQYAGLIVALDDNVGKILSKLKESGLEENTLVLFTNDNGGSLKVGANNFPLRGGKGSLWEGGTRVPWAMRWPGKIRSGTVIDDPVIALDLVPTFITIGGGEINQDWKLDGVDLTPRITGEKTSLPTRTLFWRQHGERGPIAVREGDWKLLLLRQHDDTPPQLFNLKDDVSESNDLAQQHADVVEELTKKLAKWEKPLEAPRWGPGKRK